MCALGHNYIDLGCKCVVSVWPITMVATHLTQKACGAHVISYTKPSSPSAVLSFLPPAKLNVGEELRSGNEAIKQRGKQIEPHCRLFMSSPWPRIIALHAYA